MSKPNKIILISLVIVAALVWFIYNRGAKTADQATIKIAALIPLSGNSAGQGELIKQGLDLALDEISSSGQKIEIVYSDTQGDSKKAVGAYLDLKSRENISAVITWGSSVAMAISPLSNQDHIIQMGVATAASQYRSLHDYNFRNYPTADQEEQFLTQAVKEKFGTNKKIAIFYINNDAGKSSAQNFTQNWQKLGGKIAFNEGFDGSQTDYRSELAKIKITSPDIVILMGYPSETGIILKQARQLGITAQFISPSFVLGPEMIEAAGDSAEGLLVADSSPDINTKPSQELKTFAENFNKKIGHPLTAQEIYSLRSYDALRALAAGFKHCNDDTVCAQKELEKINLPGPSGNVAFDEYGDIKANFHFVQFKNGVPHQIN